jgi:hypothetical protein
MWNSWVDREVILKVKENCKKHIDWFYLRSLKKANVRDRMLNEELYISLSYLDFKTQSSDCQFVPLDIYQKSDRINARIKEKKDISNVLLNASQSIQIKNMFIDCIKHVEQFISKIKIILIDKDISKNDLPNFLSSELEKVLLKQRKIPSNANNAVNAAFNRTYWMPSPPVRLMKMSKCGSEKADMTF